MSISSITGTLTISSVSILCINHEFWLVLTSLLHIPGSSDKYTKEYGHIVPPKASERKCTHLINLYEKHHNLIISVFFVVVVVIDWLEESPYQLMMNRVEWKYPIKRREFVALDVVHRPSMTMISKSALSPLRSGGSRYQSIVPLDEATPYVDPVDPVKRPLVRAVQVRISSV